MCAGSFMAMGLNLLTIIEINNMSRFMFLQSTKSYEKPLPMQNVGDSQVWFYKFLTH